MPLFTHGFLVLDGNGEHVGVVDDVDDAVDLAEEAAGSGAALWLAGGPDESPRENRTREQIEQEPMLAWQQSRVGRIDFERAMRLSPSKDVLPAINDIQRQMKLPPFGAPPVKSFVSVNTKTAKIGYVAHHGEADIKAGVRGISLAPAEIAFKHATEKGRLQHPDLIERNARRDASTFCLRSVPDCRRACLVGVGKNAIPDKKGTMPEDGVAYVSKIVRSQFLLQHPEAFMHLVYKGFVGWRKAARAAGVTPFGRLNVLSDLPWELICPDLFDYFSDMQFYDYTKLPSRRLPPNYHLTFSWSEPRNLELMMGETARGMNLAVPFHHPENRPSTTKNPGGISHHPKSFLGMPVISGDKHDVRPLDRFHPDAQDGPVVVGLRFKAPWYLDLIDRGKQPRENFNAFVIDVYETSGGILVGSQVPSLLKGSDSIRADDLLSASLDERRVAFERAADVLRGETNEGKRKSAVKAAKAASERSPALEQQRSLEQQRIIERDERARQRALAQRRIREAKAAAKAVKR